MNVASTAPSFSDGCAFALQLAADLAQSIGGHNTDNRLAQTSHQQVCFVHPCAVPNAISVVNVVHVLPCLHFVCTADPIIRELLHKLKS